MPNSSALLIYQKVFHFTRTYLHEISYIPGFTDSDVAKHLCFKKDNKDISKIKVTQHTKIKQNILHSQCL